MIADQNIDSNELSATAVVRTAVVGKSGEMTQALLSGPKPFPRFAATPLDSVASMIHRPAMGQQTGGQCSIRRHRRFELISWWRRGAAAQHTTGCRNRGPLENPISDPNLDPWARPAADKVCITWGPKKKKESEKRTAIRFESGCEGKTARDVKSFK